MKENKRPGQQLKGLSVQDLLGVSGEESAMEIDIRLIHPFKDHPFKVLDDDKMQDLVESIQANGVLSPVLLREAGRGQYEMISGHRRMHAAQLAGLETIPAIIREMSDDEATIIMVDSNIQREELLPSEKAFAFKMRMDAIKHQGTTFGHDVQKWSHEDIGAESGFSGRQVNRYIRLKSVSIATSGKVKRRGVSSVKSVATTCFPQRKKRKRRALVTVAPMDGSARVSATV